MSLVGVIFRRETAEHYTPALCARCGKPIASGWLYLSTPPVRHVACPSPKGIYRDRSH